MKATRPSSLSASELKRIKTDGQIPFRIGSKDESRALYIRVFKAAKTLQPFSQPFIPVDSQKETG